MSRYKHFKSDKVVTDLVQEIRSIASPEENIKRCVESLSEYFGKQFPDNHVPSRFNTIDGVVGSPKFLIGLSGGIDSTVVTYLAVKAVGSSVLPVFMPHGTHESYDKIRLVEQDLNIEILNLPINRITDKWKTETFYPPSDSHEHLYRIGNFASRLRTAILYDLQRSIRGRILGTMNYTEYIQGYGTKFGCPEAYDFGVLNRFYKCEIYDMAKHLNVPVEIIDAPPSSGFWPGQTHEEELGATLAEQDAICYIMFSLGENPVKHYGVSQEYYDLMLQRWSMAEHKRKVTDSLPGVFGNVY